MAHNLMPSDQIRARLAAGLGAFLFLSLPNHSAAQSNSLATAPAPTPVAGLLNDWLRRQSPAFDPWDIGGQIRARLEDKDFFAAPSHGEVDFQYKGASDNTYFLLRERLHLGYKPCSEFAIYAETQDSGAYGDARNPSPDNDHLQLRQAWVSLGDALEFPLTAKAGRQELSYGDQRLIGPADWLNIGRTFDAVKVRYQAPDFWVDAFGGQPVIPDRYSFDGSDNHDRLSGIYASTKTLIPVQESQLYFLARNVDEHPAYQTAEKLYPLASPRDIYTMGARISSLPDALQGWDYGMEGAGQFGRFKAANTSPSLEQQAFAAHAAAGYTWNTISWTPRLGLEFNYASGDDNSKDGKHGTFDNLYPSNHGLYGAMDFFSWQNIEDLHLGASITPMKKLELRLDGHVLWLATTHDYLYAGNGTPRTTGGYGINPSAGDNVGSELDLTASYAITRFASAQAGYSHFFAGDYVKNSLAGHGGAMDADYFYAQLTCNF
jgi:hypothetical protein